MLKDETFLTAKDLSARYKLTKWAIYDLARRGKLPKPLKIGVSVRWRLSDIEAFERND